MQKKSYRLTAFFYLAACSALFLGTTVFAQSIQPVIVEYIEKGEGKFELTNNTLTPMAVVLEPKSFNITPDGRGVYRPLDSGIHVELSTMSLRLEPKQTYYIFYKAKAEVLPAWFTVYAVFSYHAPAHHLPVPEEADWSGINPHSTGFVSHAKRYCDLRSRKCKPVTCQGAGSTRHCR